MKKVRTLSLLVRLMSQRFSASSIERRVHHRQPAIEQIGAIELAEDGHDAAGAVNVLQVHVRHRGRHLAQHRHPARQPVDVLHGEGDFAFVGGGQQMQHRVGRAAHRDIERHGVLERLEARDRARQRGCVVLLVVAARQIDDQVTGFDEQPLAVGMGREHRAVAGQRQAERLGQAVHRIGREHAGARAAGRTGRALDHLDIGVADGGVGRSDHGVDQVDRTDLALDIDLAGFHRAAGDEHGREC